MAVVDHAGVSFCVGVRIETVTLAALTPVCGAGNGLPSPKSLSMDVIIESNIGAGLIESISCWRTRPEMGENRYVMFLRSKLIVSAARRDREKTWTYTSQ